MREESPESKQKSSTGRRRWFSWRALMASLGLLLLIFLIWRITPQQLFAKIQDLGWGLAVLVFLGGVSHLVKTLAWRFSFPEEHSKLSIVRLFGVRLAGEAVSQAMVAGHVAAETTRAWMVKSAMPVAGSVSAVIADRAMYTMTSLLVAVAGLLLWLIDPTPASISGGTLAAGVVVMMAPVILWLMALKKRWPFLSGPLAALGRLWPRLSKRVPVARDIEYNLYSLYHDRRMNFSLMFFLNMVGQGLSLLEVYLILWLLGIEVTAVLTLKIEAAAKLINMMGMVIPGNLGTSEAGNMLLLGSLGLGRANGLALALARRLRNWFWTCVGLGILYFHTFVGDTMAPRGVSLRTSKRHQS